MLLLLLVIVLAFYVACNLGANDVANSMGTSVGSKAITLKQAIAIAGILEFTGAVLFGREVSSTLATDIVNPDRFVDQPDVLLLGTIAVLISCGIWLQIATSKKLPVASSHAIVGAMAGFSWVAAGIQAVDWSSLGRISLAWVVTPIFSGLVAAGWYALLRRWILTHPEPLLQLDHWIPWLAVGVVSIFGVVVFPSILDTLPTDWLPGIPRYDLALGMGSVAILAITLTSWRALAQVGDQGSEHPQAIVEGQLARFQLISACFVAFAHGSNDVGNAIAPLAAILYVQQTGTVPTSSLEIPLWVLILGGIGIVTGLAVWGKQVIETIGTGIIELQPSSGFTAELATATTVIIASRWGLPVSTSHALVGAVVGVGIIQNWRSVEWSTLRSISLAWAITLPIAAILSASIFTVLFHLDFLKFSNLAQ
jgi:PiT family inorganic phosphate transporter